MLDIHAARHAYQSKEIFNIGCVKSADNIADGLTRAKKQAQLLSTLQEGKHDVKYEQWIIREKFPKYCENKMK